MAENVSLTIDARRGDTSGLDNLERRFTDLREKMAGVRREYERLGQTLASRRGQGPDDPRPGGLRPWPANLPASPFGPAAGGPPGITPLQQAHATLFAPQAVSPVQQAHATMLAQRQATQQQQLQQAQRLALMAQMGPQPGQPPGPGAAIGGAIFGAVAGGGGFFGSLGGALGAPLGLPGILGGALIGKGLDKGVQMASQGIAAQREIEVSLLRLGDTLNQQFGTLRTTVTALRRDFQVLGQEGVQAMMGLARATGLEERALTRATYAAVGAGRYYGMTATESVGLLTAMQMTGAAAPNLTAVMAIGHEAAARYPGAISVPRFAQETGRAMEVGGLGFAPP